MRQILLMLAMLTYSSVANAQAFTDEICVFISGIGTTCYGGVGEGNTCQQLVSGSSGTTLTCTYGGQYTLFKNLLNSPIDRFCKCDPGNTGPQGPSGDQGPAGPDGLQGPPGSDGTMVIGSSEPPGLNCTYGGTALNFTSPVTGESVSYICNGETGSIGLTGPQGPQGIQGPPGLDGTNPIKYKDGNNDDVAVYDIAGVPGFWDESISSWWPIDAFNGSVDSSKCQGDYIYYSDSSCSVPSFMLADSHNRTRCLLSGGNNFWYYNQGIQSSPATTCYVHDIVCHSTTCPTTGTKVIPGSTTLPVLPNQPIPWVPWFSWD